MAEKTEQERLVSLDVFRGMTIAGMTLVNNPGTWGAIYPPLAHAEWHGVTPTDFIFPFFLFIVGVAIPIALSKRLADGITRAVFWKIFSRAAQIFLIGLLMAAFPLVNIGDPSIPLVAKLVIMFGLLTVLYLWLTDMKRAAMVGAAAWLIFIVILRVGAFPLPIYDVANLRIPGVLQRIAVCYLIVSLLFLKMGWKQLLSTGGVLLLAYWALMTLIPVPGCETTTIDSKECNLAAYIDREVLGLNHIWKQAKVYDPEGLLSTIPALVTTISGVLTGMWIRSDRTQMEKAAGMLFAGAVLIAIGYCWHPFFPYNKALWTSSYVLHTSGLALSFLGFCYFLIDIKNYRRWTKPFVIFGVNALALFIGSGLLVRVFSNIKFAGGDGKATSLQPWLYQTFFVPLGSDKMSSMLYAIWYILVWLLLMWVLYRKKIYIKV